MGVFDVDVPSKKKAKKKVAGPYRSQSSVKSVREDSQPSEHRTASSTAAGAKKERRKRRKAVRKRAGIPKVVVRGASKKVGPLDKAASTVKREFDDWLERVDENATEIPGAPEGGAFRAALDTAMLSTGGSGATKALTLASDAPAVTKVGQSAAKAVKSAPKKAVVRVKTAPKRTVAKAKAAPKKVKTAPRRAKKAVSTKQGRRRAAKGGAKKAVRHPVRTGVPAAAVSPVPLPAELDDRARAFLKGTGAALTHPGKVAETTAHGALGFVTAPLGVAAAGVESVKEGSTEPLRHEIRDLAYIPADKTGTGRPGGIGGMFESLASGDPKRVEETTLQETGLTPFIPVPHLVRRAKRTKTYEGGRGKVRAKVEGRRSGKRDKLQEEMQTAAATGAHVSKKKAKKAAKLQPVRDSQRPGENYVSRPVGRFVEKQRERHYISREAARMGAGDMAGRIAVGQVAKKLRKSKGAGHGEINHGEAVRILGKHGIPVTPAGIDFIRRVHEGYEPWKHGDTPLKGEVLDRHATQYILDHPEVLKDADVAAGIAELSRQSSMIGGHSERNRFLAQRDNIVNPIRKEEGKPPVLAPEEMVPRATEKLLPDQGKEWSRVEVIDYVVAREEQLTQLRREGRRAEAKVIERNQKAIMQSMFGGRHPLMKPPERGGAEGGVSTTRAVAYTPEMVRRFGDQMRSEGKRLGLEEPVPYLADRFPKGLEQDQVAPNFNPQIPLNKVWPSRGIAAKSGNALADLESTLYHSLAAPLQRKGAVNSLKRIFTNIERPIEGKHVLTKRQAERLANTGKVPDGTLFVRRSALRALVEQADELTPEAFGSALAREIEIGQKIASGEDIAAALKAADDMGLKGEKVVPVGAVAMHELMGQLNGPAGVSVGVGRATNFASRAILNSLAFEISQFAQEGLPMAAALSRDVVNVPKAIAGVKHISELPPELQAEIMVAVGSSAGLLGAPSLSALRSESFLNPARLTARPKVWQAGWRLVNGTYLGRFDKARAGVMRSGGAIAKLEGDLKRAEKGFRIWRTSANNLFKDMDKAVKAMRGMDPHERLAYVAAHPRLGDRLHKSMNGLAGNWNAFTVFEKNIAPFSMFYSFQRYAVLWTLYHFPMDHPVVATALAMAGEANAQELKKLAATHGGEPTVLDYAKPVVGGDVLPAGTRFAPVLGAPQQAILEGRPTALLGALPPPISIPLEAATGKSFFTGRELGENGWLYMLRQGGNLSPLARFFGIPDLGQEKTPGAKLFESQDPLRDERSVLTPTIGQSGKQYAREKQYERLYDEKYGEGHQPGPFDSKLFLDIMFGGKNGGIKSREEQRAAIRKVHRSEAASRALKHAQKRFLPASKDLTPAQEKFLEEWENAWQTGPSAEPEGTGNPYLDALDESSGGNVYLEALKQKTGGNAYLEALK